MTSICFLRTGVLRKFAFYRKHWKRFQNVIVGDMFEKLTGGQSDEISGVNTIDLDDPSWKDDIDC